MEAALSNPPRLSRETGTREYPDSDRHYLEYFVVHITSSVDVLTKGPYPAPQRIE
jgi:hypothetical protein